MYKIEHKQTGLEKKFVTVNSTLLFLASQNYNDFYIYNYNPLTKAHISLELNELVDKYLAKLKYKEV